MAWDEDGTTCCEDTTSLELNLNFILISFQNDSHQVAAHKADIIAGANRLRKVSVVDLNDIVGTGARKVQVRSDSCGLTHHVLNTSLGSGSRARSDFSTTHIEHHSASLIGTQALCFKVLANHTSVILFKKVRLSGKKLVTYLSVAMGHVEAGNRHASVDEADDVGYGSGSRSKISHNGLVAVSKATHKHGRQKSTTSQSGKKVEGDLPDGAADLGLVLGEVNVLEDHVLAVAHEVFVVLVAEVAPVALPVVEGGAAVFGVVFKLFVDHCLGALFLYCN